MIVVTSRAHTFDTYLVMLSVVQMYSVTCLSVTHMLDVWHVFVYITTCMTSHALIDRFGSYLVMLPVVTCVTSHAR